MPSLRIAFGQRFVAQTSRRDPVVYVTLVALRDFVTACQLGIGVHFYPDHDRGARVTAPGSSCHEWL